MRDYKEYTLLNESSPIAISSSTDATPIVITTSANHGLSTGDIVTIQGHSTNTNANGTRMITVLSDTTFSLQDLQTESITGSGAGAGSSGVVSLGGKVINVNDFANAVVDLATDGGGTAAMTVKFVGSIGKKNGEFGPPDFAQPQSKTNMYDFIQVADLESGQTIAGDTGIVVSSSDDYRLLEMNINALSFVGVLITTGTSGSMTVKMKVYNNR